MSTTSSDGQIDWNNSATHRNEGSGKPLSKNDEIAAAIRSYAAEVEEAQEIPGAKCTVTPSAVNSDDKRVSEDSFACKITCDPDYNKAKPDAALGLLEDIKECLEGIFPSFRSVEIRNDTDGTPALFVQGDTMRMHEAVRYPRGTGDLVHDDYKPTYPIVNIDERAKGRKAYDKLQTLMDELGLAEGERPKIAIIKSGPDDVIRKEHVVLYIGVPTTDSGTSKASEKMVQGLDRVAQKLGITIPSGMKDSGYMHFPLLDHMALVVDRAAVENGEIVPATHIVDSTLNDRQKQAFLRFLPDSLSLRSGNDCSQTVSGIERYYEDKPLAYNSLGAAADAVGPSYKSFSDDIGRALLSNALHDAYGKAHGIRGTSIPERSGALASLG